VDGSQWVIAMQDELKSLHENGTWTWQTLQKDPKAVPCHWLFDLKWMQILMSVTKQDW
jgi:hypothetical protein